MGRDRRRILREAPPANPIEGRHGMTLQSAPQPGSVIETSLTGVDLINQPLLNKGTAFTEAERDTFRLHGVLPPSVGTLEDRKSVV